MKIFGKYADKLQRWGLDEAFLDVGSRVCDFDAAVELAVDIKHEILWSERLTCSVGVASNKLVAKIASDFEKPDGLTVVTEADVEKFLAPLPVRRLLWVGRKTESRLNEMGIRTIGDLAAFDVSMLTEKFGVMGARYHRWAHGIYGSEVAGRKGMMKSVGHETTFMTDTNDCDVVLKIVDKLSQRVHDRIVRRNILFKTVTVKMRYENYQTYTRGKTLPFFSNRLQDLQKMARELVYNHLHESRKIRLVGVRVTNLKSNRGQRTLV